MIYYQTERKLNIREEGIYMNKERINNAYDVMNKKGLSALIITDRYNMNYLSGYMGDAGMLLFTKSKKILLTDSRYIEIASIQAKEFDAIDIGMDGYAKVIVRLIGEDMTDSSDYKVGFENESISYREYKDFVDAFEGLKAKTVLVEVKGLVDDIREVKSAEEIEYLAMAESIGDKAFDHIVTFIKEGMTEKEIALELEVSMKKFGADGLSFDTIIASGTNSSMPHAVPSDRKVEAGDFVTMDFGCIYKGYCSDMTRTVIVGGKEPSEKQLEIYNTVLKAQLESLKMVKPGVVCSEVDACARKIISDAGYGEYFGHGLGHGVGLFIHEEPRLSRKCDKVLQPGMIVTVEPGIYLPGEFGVRIEDMVAVTEDGARNLASSPKELITV